MLTRLRGGFDVFCMQFGANSMRRYHFRHEILGGRSDSRSSQHAFSPTRCSHAGRTPGRSGVQALIRASRGSLDLRRLRCRPLAPHGRQWSGRRWHLSRTCCVPMRVDGSCHCPLNWGRELELALDFKGCGHGQPHGVMLSDGFHASEPI